MHNFSHVTDWVFDLDNTLYPAECNLFAQIDVRMTEYVARLLDLPPAEARIQQKKYYVEYGTTLSGLMHEHNIEAEHFMDHVHDIDLSPVARNDELAKIISSLPGRKFVYTNGSIKHAENVTTKLGIDHVFDDMFDIKAAHYMPKPKAEPYDLFLKSFDIKARNAAMFEDLAVNLEVPNTLGMTTVLVCSDSDWLDNEPSLKRPARLEDIAPHVQYRTSDLTEFLASLMTGKTS